MSNNVGTSTPSDRVRNAHRKLLKTGQMKTGQKVSLKAFVKSNIEKAKEARDDSANDEKEWLLNKKGSKNQERAQSTIKRITEEKLASKGSGKKK